MNVSLRPLEDGGLDAIYRQVTDPESVRMAAFTAEDQTDRRAFLDRMSRLRADASVSYRVIDVDGAIAGTIGSFRIDDEPEVTFWVDRSHWGKASRARPYRSAPRLRWKQHRQPVPRIFHVDLRRLPSGRRGDDQRMIGLALALVIVGVIFLFVIPWVGIPVGIVGLVLLVVWLLGFGRRATTTEPRP